MKYILIFVVLALLMACSGHNHEKVSETLKQAQNLHKESIVRYNALKSKLDSLENIYPNKEAFQPLSTALNTWHNDLVEVPGLPHDHEGHDHDHEPPPELTEEQHLAVQQEMLEHLKNLEDQYDQLSTP